MILLSAMSTCAQRFAVVATAIMAACTSNGPSFPGGGSGSGTLSNLVFAVVGDTRPTCPDDTANYPTPVITKIYQDIASENPAPAFVVATGDYMFTTGPQAQPQLDLYMGARMAFPGNVYPVMGNHECDSLTSGNCASSPTENMAAFVHTMLEPIGMTGPYYTETFAAADGGWTAKLVFIACNAWDSAQASWLERELAKPTTYTFVVRHESVLSAMGAPCPASDATIDAYPLTLRIVGHTHLYNHDSANKQLVVGNGGAPLTSGANYGYVMIERNADGTLTITAYDYISHATMDSFTISPNG
jgi:hypothetical protein